jgi:hypothetical protein
LRETIELNLINNHFLNIIAPTNLLRTIGEFYKTTKISTQVSRCEAEKKENETGVKHSSEIFAVTVASMALRTLKSSLKGEFGLTGERERS